MTNWYKLNKGEKYFALVLLLGFLVKYNFLFLRIFQVTSVTGVVLRNLFFLLVFTYLILPLVKSNRARRLLYLGYIFFTIIFLGNYWYNAYFGNYLSVHDMIMGRGTGDFSIIEVVVRHIFNWYDIFFFLDVILLSNIYFRSDFKKKKYTFSFSRDSKTSRKIIPLLLILCLLVGQVFVTNNLLGGHSPVELYREGTNYFANVYGLFPLYGIELYSILRPLELEPVEDPPQLGRELPGEDKIDEETNIIFIQWESIDERLINYEYNGRELTPFINQLKEESIYFNNFYAQKVSGSFDADFSVLTSLYPVNRNYTYRENDLTEFDSLVRKLNDLGYETLAFHGNDREFFHRHLAFPELGFDRFYARDDYSMEDTIMEVERDSLGINDYDFFHQSLDMLEQATEPYFGLFITVTSHTPFDFFPPEEKVEEYTEVENQLVEDFFHSITFVDRSIEMFFNELEERGLKEDTLFIIYSDHESAIEEEEYTSFRQFNLDRNVKKPHHIPFLIYHSEGKIEPEVNETTGTFIDIAPTLLDLMGKEELPDEFMGRSLLEKEERPILFLHEIPQVLFQDQLFVIDQREFEQIGYREQTGRREVEFSEEMRNKIFSTIDYLRNEIFTRRRE